jgi:hypothetical protein
VPETVVVLSGQVLWVQEMVSESKSVHEAAESGASEQVFLKELAMVLHSARVLPIVSVLLAEA